MRDRTRDLRLTIDRLAAEEARYSSPRYASDAGAAERAAWARRHRLAAEAELDRLMNPDPAARWAPSLSLFGETA